MNLALLRTGLVWMRPLLFFLATLAGAVTVVVVLVSTSPGTAFDALPSVPEALKQELTVRYGLDQAWYVQAARRLWALAHLEFDVSLSYRSGGRVAALLWPAFRSTLVTVSLALLLSFALAAGAVALSRRGPRRSGLVSVGLTVVSGVPAFVAAVVVQALLAAHLDLMPDFRHVVVAALVLAVADGNLLGLFQQLGAEWAEARSTDHVVAARANGLGARGELLRTLFAPVAQLVTTRFTLLLGAVLVVEIPFGLYGIGEVLYQAASRRDTHLVVGCLVFLSALVCGAGLLRDFARLAVDPRLRRAGAPRLE